MTYQYVYIALKNEFNVIFEPLNLYPNVKFIEASDKKQKSPLLELLRKIHFSHKLNKIISLPFKSIWGNRFFQFLENIPPDSENCCCFIINARYYEHFGSLITDFIYKRYQNCVCCCFFTDLVSNHNIDLNKIYKDFQLIMSYEKTDCEKYNFKYLAVPYSKIIPPAQSLDMIKPSDIVYIGNVKNRLPRILSVLKKCKDFGLVCDFMLYGIPLDDRLAEALELYINNGVTVLHCQIPYSEYIAHVMKSNCILEIIQEDSTAITLRACEAVTYNKKLLTDCINIKNEDFYNPECIQVFSKPEEIQIDFVKNRKAVSYDYDKFSFFHMMRRIEKYLEEISIR